MKLSALLAHIATGFVHLMICADPLSLTTWFCCQSSFVCDALAAIMLFGAAVPMRCYWLLSLQVAYKYATAVHVVYSGLLLWLSYLLRNWFNPTYYVQGQVNRTGPRLA